MPLGPAPIRQTLSLFKAILGLRSKNFIENKNYCKINGFVDINTMLLMSSNYVHVICYLLSLFLVEFCAPVVVYWLIGSTNPLIRIIVHK